MIPEARTDDLAALDLLWEFPVVPETMTERLATVRRLRDECVPAEYTAIMDRAIDDLARTNMHAAALKTGDACPAFMLPDREGTWRSAYDLLRKGPLVVSFYRGSWCPFCNIELRGLQRALPEIVSLGAQIVAISPELPDRQAETKTSGDLDFPILHDSGNKVGKWFGIVHELPPDLLEIYRMMGHDLKDANGPRGATELPLPATFVVTPGGWIRLAYVDEDYARRLSPDDIVAGLRKLA